jgi:hypothetical protein
VLPDYPKTKVLLAELYRDRIRRAHNIHLGVFSDVPSTQMHEGGKHVLVREDGSVDEMEPRRVEAAAELRLDIREIEKLDAKEVSKSLDTIGEGLARGMFKMFLDTIDEAATKVGNVTTPGTSAVAQYFEAMEKRMLNFDDEGQPEKMNVLAGSEKTARKLQEVESQIQSDAELRRRYESIIEKKRQEWRDREAARNLVE